MATPKKRQATHQPTASTIEELVAAALIMKQPNPNSAPPTVTPLAKNYSVGVTLQLQNLTRQTQALEAAASAQARFIMQHRHLIADLTQLQQVLAVMPVKSHERLVLIAAKRDLLTTFQAVFTVFPTVPKEDYRQFLLLVAPRITHEREVAQVQHYLQDHGAPQVARDFGSALANPKAAPTQPAASSRTPVLANGTTAQEDRVWRAKMAAVGALEINPVILGGLEAPAFAAPTVREPANQRLAINARPASLHNKR